MVSDDQSDAPRSVAAVSAAVHYQALALQVDCHAVNGLEADAARVRIMDNIAIIARQVHASRLFIGTDTRLVVLPEYFLTGYPMGDPVPAWAAKAAIAPDGPEYEALGRIAADNDIFLAGNVYETDPHFPDLYFQACFLLAPSGDCVLRYRRLISMFAPTPHDVWDRYVDLYGLDAVFPVADTALGRVAAIASEEILYPEIARAMALRGAEVFVHCTSEVGSPGLTPKAIARRARAVENMAYVVSANSAAIHGTPIPAASTSGMSTIIDFRGNVLVEAGYGESMVANAELDIDALRRWRRRPGMGNLLSRQRLELFAATYTGASIHPPNTMLDADSGAVLVPERSQFLGTQKNAIEQLIKRGVL